MKNPIDIIKALPKEVLELMSFITAAFLGSLYKVLKQNQKGTKVTAKSFFVEMFFSLFVAFVVWASLDQFFHFNRFFTYMMCSLAGSMSSPLHDKFLELIETAFEGAKKIIKMKSNIPVLGYFFFFLFLVIAGNVAVSCAVSKPLATSESVTNNDSITSHESDSKTDTNKEIKDKATLDFSNLQTSNKDCDSVCKAALYAMMAQFNIDRQSGDNRYSVLWDKYNKQLTINSTIGATSNKTLIVKDSYLIRKTVKLTKTVPAKYIPDFWRYSAYFGWAAAVFLVVWVANKIRKLWQPKISIT